MGYFDNLFKRKDVVALQHDYAQFQCILNASEKESLVVEVSQEEVVRKFVQRYFL